MVNVNNYGVQGTNYTTGTNQKSTQTQKTGNVPVNQNRPNDQYSFESNNMATGKVPSVGTWDKMSTYFKNVMSTPQNIAKYKAFEQAIKSNPDGYLTPSTYDVGKVKDLQKKLNFLGMKLEVNGKFGSATETAIIRFKNSVGINDGFMDKSGKMAVTPIVTPKMWQLLNAQVAQKQNPNNSVVGTSYVTPVTPEELNWAKNLAGKIQQYGYKPSENERQRYANIYQRQQLNTQQTTLEPSAQEMQWAKQFAQKVQQGYKPTQQEISTYQNIFSRNKAAQANKPDKNGVTPNDMAWAQDFANKVRNGYNPTPDEQIKYQAIYQRSTGQTPNYNVQNNQQVQQNNMGNNRPVTQQELNWAQNLETKVSQGYNPSAQERAQYEDIYKRTQGQPVQNTQQTQQQNNVGNPVTQQELSWAQDFENRVTNQGYKPTQQEMQVYQDIYNRSQTQGTQNTQQTQQTNNVNRPTQKEIDWALDLENKTKQGYKPNQNELAIYNDIATRLKASEQSGNNNQVQNNQQYNDNSSQDVDNSGSYNNNSVSNNNYSPSNDVEEEFVYNAATINAFKSAFPNTAFKGTTIPYLPDNVAKQVAQQYGFNSVRELQQAIGAGVDGKFGPETFFRLNKANNQQTQQNNTVGNTSSNALSNTSNNQNGVTQRELDWAVDLQNRYTQGYKPTAQEQQQYTEIFNRYQASGQNIISESDNTADVSQTDGMTDINQMSSNTGAPTQEEVDWAASLQVQVGQGYKPTAQEQQQYTDIYNRYQASGNQVASANTGVQNNAYQTQNYQTQQSSNVGMVGINTSNNDPDLQWALNLLDRFQQGYQPTNDELTKYEQVIARNRQ
ncbi:MAG: hypothetical protein U0354_04910 [Candidatus Sericytochromatia bacterium]